jgi:fatty acid desaturase
MMGTYVHFRTGEGYRGDIPSRLNFALVGLFTALAGFQLFVLPLWLLPLSKWWALLLIACLLSTTTNWSLIHEAIHRLLGGDVRINEACGRLLAILFGSPLEMLRFAHLLHHQLNGTPADRPEHYEAAKTSRAMAAIRYYPYLVIGIYAAEVASTFACLMPKSVLERMTRLFPVEHGADARAAAYLLQPARLVQIRIDAFLVILVYALAFLCYGPFWPLLALSILARGVIVSVADNSYHYRAPLGCGPASAYNFKLRWSAGILNFNLHRIHHAHPNLSWVRLPDAFRADAERCDSGYVSALLQQFRGPISDRDYARLSQRS